MPARLLNRLRELALWAGALLGVAAIVVGIAVAGFGFSFLVFRSGSMSPDIPTGGLALARHVPAAAIAPGDVVSVPTDTGQRVTHRVVSSTVRDGVASLVLKGDANAVADAEVYQVTGAERVVASVPYGGYLVAHLLTPPGLLSVTALVLMLLLLGFSGPEGESDPSGSPVPARRPRAGPVHRGSRRSGRRLRPVPAVGLVAVLATVLAVAGLGRVSGTWAAFTDPATLKTGSFSAGSASPPTAVTCTGTGANAYITWAAPAGTAPSSYAITYTYPGGSGSDTVTGPMLRYRPAAVITLGRTYTVSVAAVVGNWTSAAVTSAKTITYSTIGGYVCN